MFCLSFPLDPVLHHDHQRLVVQICNCTISTEVYCQQTYRTFISCWTWNRAQLNKFTTNFVIYRFKDYLFIWAWNDVVAFATNAVFLLFLVVLHGLYTTQHKCNVNYKKGRGAPQNRDHLRKRVLFKRRFTYIFIGSRLFISTRAYFKYACFKRPGRLKWWPCFGRAVNDRHGFFQVRRPRSPICKVCLSFSQRIFDFQIE